ncbi:MAG TPA: hypothetical protein VFB24_05365 [Candidatus Binatia bacterium]|nr:hypothetical protein [Candidatus Binatia bacterium]
MFARLNNVMTGQGIVDVTRDEYGTQTGTRGAQFRSQDWTACAGQYNVGNQQLDGTGMAVSNRPRLRGICGENCVSQSRQTLGNLDLKELFP